MNRDIVDDLDEFEELEQVKAQRDELLAALERLADEFVSNSDVPAVIHARAAIARVKP